MLGEPKFKLRWIYGSHLDVCCGKWYSNSRVVPCPSFLCRGECRDDSTATLDHGGRMANHDQDWEESNFEITSKRQISEGGQWRRSGVD